MSCEKYLVIAILACAACTALAKPNGMAFDVAINQTVCRTKVEYDKNKDRIPKIIKMIKCADDPYEMCPSSGGASTPCCGALPLASAVRFSCTEVQDVVLVRNTITSKDDAFSVAIGCSCIRQTLNKAEEPY